MGTKDTSTSAKHYKSALLLGLLPFATTSESRSVLIILNFIYFRYCVYWQKILYIVWPKILAGRYFGGLLKICHLAEFTLAVEPVS